jgi:cellulose biosynthesis protein BcsQ
MVPNPSDAPSQPAPIIAMAGFQSGAGKTKAALYLAGGLASHGARVLLIDTDIQNSIALALGVSDPELSALDAQGKTFGSALSKGWPLASCASEDNPAVIYAGYEIAAVEFGAMAAAAGDSHAGGSPYAALIQHTLAWRARTL